jgi:hypothetical protein
MNLSTNIISTIAGTGSTQYSGDGGLAINANMQISGIAIDNSSNIYISDYANSVIRKITKPYPVISGALSYNNDIAQQLCRKSGLTSPNPISGGGYASIMNNTIEPIIQKSIPILGQVFTSNSLSAYGKLWNIITSSQNSLYQAFNAFNGTTTNYWQSGGGNYNLTTGLYSGTSVATSYYDLSNTTTATIIYGEWIQVQLPYSLKLTDYSFITNNPNSQIGVSGEPVNWVILGSNDNTNWYLESSANNIIPVSTGTLRTYPAVSNKYYNYHKFVINRLAANSNTANVALCQWNLNGIYNYTDSSIPVNTNYSNIEQIVPPLGIQMTSNTLTFNNRSYTVSSSSTNSLGTKGYTNLPYTAFLNLPYNNDISSSLYNVWSCSGSTTNSTYNTSTGLYSTTGSNTTQYYGGNSLSITAKDLSLNATNSSFPTIGTISMAVNKLYNRIVYCASGGSIYSGTISGITITSTAPFDTTPRNYYSLALTTDATRGVACDGSYCHYFTWNGITYTNLTRIDSTQRNYNSIAISSDGSRMVAAVGLGYIYYSIWNGTSYNPMTQTLETAYNNYKGIALSLDGTRLVYGTNGGSPVGGYVLYSVWNGTNYTAGIQIQDTQQICARNLAFSNDMNVLYYSTNSNSPNNTTATLWISTYIPSVQNYGTFYPVPTSIIPTPSDAHNLCLSSDGQSLYIMNYSVATTPLYQLSTNIFHADGEWLQMQLSQPAKITNYGILPSPNALTSLPQMFYLLGSNDGSTWYLLDSETVSTAPTITTSKTVSYYATTTSQSTNYYTYFRLVINSIFSGNSNGFATLGQLQLIGTYL